MAPRQQQSRNKPGKRGATPLPARQEQVHHHAHTKSGWLAMVFLVVSFAVTANWPPSPLEGIDETSSRSINIDLPQLETAAAEVAEPTAGDEPEWINLVVKPGDSLEKILLRQGLPRSLALELLSTGNDARMLKDLHPGQIIKIVLAENGGIEQLQFSPSKTETLRITQSGEGYASSLEQREYDIQLKYAEGHINDALFLAGQKAGLSDNVIMKLAALFAWDVDFVLDIRRGDSFRLLYEEYYLDGEKVRDGDILAADFVNRGKTFTAFRHTAKDGDVEYYSPDGRSIRKEFIRTPVAFTRISSPFNLNRKHPILHTIRAHRGVDYAAPRGTPIKSAGEGRVTYAGRKGGYGYVVEIQHGQTYSTLYAHLKNFARGIRKGARVKQGQTIAYVGSSGLATGPHLHYEFRVNGIHKNPLSVPLPKARPIEAAEKESFLANAESLRSRLSLLSEVYTIARNDIQQ